MPRSLIQLIQLSKSYTKKIILDDVFLSINEGDCFAIIGENGSGKSTLLKILAGILPPDEGCLQKNCELEILYLSQEMPKFDRSKTVREFLDNENLIEIKDELKKLEEYLDDPSQLEKWSKLHEQFEKKGGYSRTPLEPILQGLKVHQLLELPLSELSSGQRMRVHHARIFSNQSDLLLLDEPTNHLDKESVALIIEKIKDRKKATLIVSHDRSFLNKTCNRLIEIENGKLKVYGGNYDFYLQEKERFLESRLKVYEETKARLKEVRKKICHATFSKAKPKAPKDRDIIAYDSRGGRNQKSQKRALDDLKAKESQLEENLISNPKPNNIPKFRFIAPPLQSPFAIEIDSISKSFEGKIIFSNLSKFLYPTDRVILQGPNGAGKTTLMKCLYGLLPLDSGKIVKAKNISIAYLDQEIESLDLKKTALEYFLNKYSMSEESLHSELQKIGFEHHDLLKRPFGALSVGQRKKMMLLSMIWLKPNVLFLDEPTNHLDLVTLEAFEKALLQFEGAIIAISHDETFAQKIATDYWFLGTR